MRRYHYCLFLDGRLKIVFKKVIVSSQKASNTPDLSINYNQTGLFFSFFETEMVPIYLWKWMLLQQSYYFFY